MFLPLCEPPAAVAQFARDPLVVEELSALSDKPPAQAKHFFAERRFWLPPFDLLARQFLLDSFANKLASVTGNSLYIAGWQFYGNDPQLFCHTGTVIPSMDCGNNFPLALVSRTTKREFFPNEQR
jgi:hypothetical protein